MVPPSRTKTASRERKLHRRLVRPAMGLPPKLETPEHRLGKNLAFDYLLNSGLQQLRDLLGFWQPDGTKPLLRGGFVDFTRVLNRRLIQNFKCWHAQMRFITSKSSSLH